MQNNIINQQLLESYSDDVKEFLRPIYAARNVYENDLDLSLKNLLQPNFPQLEIALKILHKALLKQQNILIVGDFDADGATSCALAIKSLRMMGAQNIDFLVPNRFTHGYGLSPAIVEIAKTKKLADIIITVDNGISSFDGVDLANKYGIKVIITDHHLPNEVLPNAAAIINPNLKDCQFASKNLAGVGVAFYLFSALKTYLEKCNYFQTYNIPHPRISTLLDLVALGTVADVVPLDKNNRILVNAGLELIRTKNCSIGLLAILQIAKKSAEFIKSSDLGFSIAPRLNASGRMKDMSYGIKCLLSIDYADANNYALQLDEFNQLRKDTQQQMTDDTEKIIYSQKLNNDNFAICLYDKSWHEGVVGIVAGKLKENNNCPTVIFAKSGENLKGSARSIPSVHIKDLLDLIDRKNPNLIAKFGGHAMAAGLIIQENNFEKFNQAFVLAVKNWLGGKLPSAAIITDGQLKEHDITLANAKLLEQNIWGSGFEEPIFYGEFAVVDKKIVGEKHLKLRLKLENLVFDAMVFFTTEIAKNITISYRLSVNYYNGSENLQLILKDIM